MKSWVMALAPLARAVNCRWASWLSDCAALYCATAMLNCCFTSSRSGAVAAPFRVSPTSTANCARAYNPSRRSPSLYAISASRSRTSARWLKPRHDKAFSSGPCGMPQKVASYWASTACRDASAAAAFPASASAAARSSASPCRARYGSDQAEQNAQYDDPQAAQQPCNSMFHNANSTSLTDAMERLDERRRGAQGSPAAS